MKDFLPYDIFYDAVNHLYPENSICSTIEGQIVFIADEIARRSHDLDDALSAGLLNMNNLMDTLSLKKLHAPKLEIEVLKQGMDSTKGHHHVFVSEHEFLITEKSTVFRY